VDQGNRIIRLQSTPASTEGVLDTRFSVELRDPRTPDLTGGRSMQGQVAVRCATRDAKLDQLTIYAETGAKGEVVRRFDQSAWVRPEPETLLSAVVSGVCRSDPPPRPTSAASARGAVVRPAPPEVRAAEPSRPKASRAAPSAPTTPGRYRLQLGSFPSEAEAEAFVAAARARTARFGPMLLEPARVGSARYHRVLIPGYPSAPAAEAACREVRAAGFECLVKAPLRGVTRE
jgi:cell division septation protein DedD